MDTHFLVQALQKKLFIAGQVSEQLLFPLNKDNLSWRNKKVNYLTVSDNHNQLGSFCISQW